MSEGKWSAVAMLRAWGESFDVDAFTQVHDVSPEKAWHRGELSRSGRTPEHSGFSLVVADAASAQELEGNIASFLTLRTRFLKSLGEASVHVEMDVGLMVYPMLSRGFSLPPALLIRLGDAGINLRITAYPCSDDEEQ